jgi:hypothetical protein
MANVDFEWNPDEALDRWEKIKAEEAENHRRRTILNARNALPYSESLAMEICERISCGELLIVICNDDHLPTVRRCKQWMAEHDDFAMLYKDSLNDRLDISRNRSFRLQMTHRETSRKWCATGEQ